MQTTPMQTTTPDDDRPQGGILPLGPTIAILEDEAAAARHLHIAISRSTIMQTTPMQTTTPDDDRPQGGILPLGPTPREGSIAILEDEAARHLHIAISRSTIMQTTKHEAINEKMRIAASRPVEKVTDNRTRLERFNDAFERFTDAHPLIFMAITMVSFVVVGFFMLFMLMVIMNVIMNNSSFIKNEEIAYQKMEQACAAKGGTVEDVVGVKGHTTQGCVVPLA